MILLHETEAIVLEHVRQGLTAVEISRIIGISRGSVVSKIARLSELSAIEKISYGKYRVLITEYGKTDRLNAGHSRSDKLTVEISPEQEAYIRKHVQTTPRTQMARALKLDKVSLNLMIIQLRLGRSN